MQALIDFIIRNLLALWPFTRIYEWEAAMMVRNGRIQRPLQPGVHWRWLFIEEKRIWPKTEVVVTLPTCSLTTADGIAIAIDANFGYRLTDIVLAWRSLWSMESSLKAAASGIFCSHLATKPWAHLQGHARSDREDELRAALIDFAAPRGLSIERVHLVACVQARQHRHFVDGSLKQ